MAITTTRYSNAGGVPLTQKVGATASVLLPDPQGNVIGRIDSTQAVVGKTWYWPYGELRTGALGSSLGYGGTWGYYTDNTSNRIYIRARYLKPNYTRWLTVDPLWPEERAYVYVDSEAATLVDSSGLKAATVFNDVGCGLCALAIYFAWAGRNPVHDNNHGYAHCMACCYLAHSFGPSCASTAQALQNELRPVDNPGVRLAECQAGINLGLQSPGSDPLQKCHAGCLKKYKPSDPAAGHKPFPPGGYPSAPFPCPAPDHFPATPFDPWEGLPRPGMNDAPRGCAPRYN